LLAGKCEFAKARAVVACALLAMCLVAARLEAQTVALPLLPTSVAYDAAGNLFFADTNRHQIYESSLAGVLTVVAGDGVQGFMGDGGPAVDAHLDSPQGIAVGADGALYIADTGNERIRAVRGGVITTIAGNGTLGFGGDGGTGLNAAFRWPSAIAIDASGGLLVCDSGNERVRRIRAGLITTIAGDGNQGFAGDGGPAVAARLDTPTGLAVAADGRIFVADSHNDRIRIIAMDGRIGTFAGDGVRGFTGDGGAATKAELSLPRGLMVTSSGAVIFADSNNQRIRMVTAGGMISTIVGSGVQGAVNDGGGADGAGLNAPRGVAMSMFGALVYADALNHLVRESVANGKVYLPAGLAVAKRTTTVALNLNPGANSGEVIPTVNVAGSAGVPEGVVQLLDGASVLMQMTLVDGAAAFGAMGMTGGTHWLTAVYSGDGINPAANSAAVNVNTSSTVVTATANAQSAEYGAAIPALTGLISGVLPQDAGKVEAVFSTSAGPVPQPGEYAIDATLTGPSSAMYRVVMSPTTGLLKILQATSLTVSRPLEQGSYEGLPLLLTAAVSSTVASATTQQTPTGTVQFFEGSAVVGTGTLVGGVAVGAYLSPGVGMHSIVASYGGDADFRVSSSQAMVTSVSAMPNFTITSSGTTTQTIAGGGMASYAMSVGALNGAFTGAVDFSASGVPEGATVAFSPAQVVPGATVVPVTMNVQTKALVATGMRGGLYRDFGLACLLLPVWLIGRRRSRSRPWVAACGMGALLISGIGCGARTIATVATGGQTYRLTVTGTSTNLAGAVVSHSMPVTLVVQ
jgi:sugar lactone lactonase YvrE